MRKQLITVALLALASGAMAAGENNVGSCGWGSKVFAGQSGIGPQVLAGTTNGTFGNQTFGITFGTSGCTPNGTVSSNWKTAMFIDGNKFALSRDAAAGQGESIDALAALMGVSAADKALFAATMKDQYATVFANDQVAANMKHVLAADARLASYAQTL